MTKNRMLSFKITIALILILVVTLALSCAETEAPTAPSPAPTPAPATAVTEKPFPSKPIAFVVPYSAGGGTDRIARIIAGAAPMFMDVPLKVVDMPGGGGTEGAKFVAHSEPDGYTLLFATGGCMLGPMLRDVGYTNDDTTAICLVTTGESLLVCRPDAPWNDFGDFVAYAKSHPNEVTCAFAGVGNSAHICAELLWVKAGIKIKAVPFDGASDCALNVMGGHVDTAFASVSSFVPQIEAGQLKALVVTGSERKPDLPDVPTPGEFGIEHEFLFARTIEAPTATPPDRIAILENIFKQVLEEAGTVRLIELVNLDPPNFMPSAEVQKLLSKMEKDLIPVVEEYKATMAGK